MSGTLVVVQARSTSTRLPKKHAVRFGGYTALEHVVLRARAAIRNVVVATPASDHAVQRACATARLRCVAPDVEVSDVLGRFRAVAETERADVLVRLTADCPFVQPYHIQAVVALAKLHGFAALGPRSGWPDGLDVEAFRRDWLWAFTDREHVTAGVEPRALVWSPQPLDRHRWTLDTRADLRWFRHISTLVSVEPPFAPTVDALLKVILSDEASHGRFSESPRRDADVQQAPDARQARRRVRRQRPRLLDQD